MTVTEWTLATAGKVPESLRIRPLSVLAARAAPPVTPKAAPAPALQARDLDAVFDALVIGGCPRGKTWLMSFLKASGHRHQRGAMLSHGEVTQALQQLAAAGRLTIREGEGYGVTESAIAARLPALLARADARKFWLWSLWSSGPGYGDPDRLPSWLRLDTAPEAASVFRLLMYLPGMTLTEYARMVSGVLGTYYTRGAVLTALVHPFLPAEFERMDRPLRDRLLDTVAPGAIAAPLEDWMEALLARAPAEVPQNWCFRIAERRMLALDFDGMKRALATQPHTPVHDLFSAAELTAAGRWDDAVAVFAPAYKSCQQITGARRGAAPMGLTWIYPLALLAQQTPAALTLARKFFTAESGSRKPSPFDSYGRWVHAAGVRLGDEKLVDEAFGFQSRERLMQFEESPMDAAHRLLLAAWLDTPCGWNAAGAAALQETLMEQRLYWLAALAHQAARRLKLAVSPPLPETAPAAAVGTTGTAGVAAQAATAATTPPSLPPMTAVAPFFGAEREVWRDALAAIAALGGSGVAAKSAAAAPVTLGWS